MVVRIVLVVLAAAAAAAAGGCGPIDEGSAVGRAVARINSGPGISVGTPHGGGTLGTRAQRERAERDLHGWGGRPLGGPLGGAGALRDGSPPRWPYGPP